MTKTKLLSPVKIGNLELKNKVVMALMCMYSVEKEDGIITDFHKIHYGARALGGVSLINIEGTAIDVNGRISSRDLGLWNQEQANAFKDLIATLHKFGSKVGIQLSHAGRKATGTEDLIAPSEIAYNEDFGTPREMTLSDIDTIVEKFGISAKYAEEAGADLIEVHAAHGYLLNEFISPLTNKRTDEYGGTLENRYRLVRRVIDKVKEVFSGSIWVRISANEYDEKGTTMDEFIQIARWMKEQGVEVIDVSSGGVIEVTPDKIYPGYQVERATKIKNEVGIDVSVVGFLNDPKLAEFLLQTNQTSLISLGRPLLANPNWIQNAAKELRAEDDIQLYNASYERGRII